MQQQTLCRLLVLREIPHRPEKGDERGRATLRTRREAMSPALLRDLRSIAFGNGPCTRRVHDQCTLARDQPFVVGGIVPRRRVWRKESHQLLVVLENLPHIVVFDGDVSFSIDYFGPKGLEERADGIDGVGGLTDTDAKGKAALMAGLCRFQERVRRPVLG